MLLFPSESGAVCTQAAMEATVEASAVRLQIATLGPLGNRLFGGHSWRASGAQALTAAGVPEHVVFAMGRWRGPTVRRHMAEAPLASSCELAAEFHSACSTRNILADLSVETAQIEADTALLRAVLAILGADTASEATNLQVAFRCAESVDDPVLPVNGATWLENSRSGIMHIAWVCGTGVPAITWRMKCGWRFSSAPFCIWPARRRNALMCSGCFKGAPLASEEEEQVGTVPPPDQALTRRVGDLRHERQCRFCPWLNWHVQLCPRSFLFAPQPLDLFFPCVSLKSSQCHVSV